MSERRPDEWDDERIAAAYRDLVAGAVPEPVRAGVRSASVDERPRGPRWIPLAAAAAVVVLVAGVAGTALWTSRPNGPGETASPGAAALGIDMVSVDELIRRGAARDLDGREVAVRAFLSVTPPIPCPAPRPDAPPLELRCPETFTWLMAQPEITFDRAAMSGGRPEGPALSFYAREASGRPMHRDQEPVEVIAIGHYDDLRAALCPAESRETCRRTFVVDRFHPPTEQLALGLPEPWSIPQNAVGTAELVYDHITRIDGTPLVFLAAGAEAGSVMVREEPALASFSALSGDGVVWIAKLLDPSGFVRTFAVLDGRIAADPLVAYEITAEGLVGRALSVGPSPTAVPPEPTVTASPTVAGWPGRTWERVEVREIDGEPVTSLSQPVAGDGVFVARVRLASPIGEARQAYSDDGRTWHFADVPDRVGLDLAPVAFGDRHWLMLAAQQQEVYEPFTSTDGRTWTRLPGDPLVVGDGTRDSVDAGWPREVVWHAGSWYVLVSQPQVAREVVFRSATGADWQAVSSFPAEGSFRLAIASDGTTLVVPQLTSDQPPFRSEAVSSTDGETWIRGPFPDPGSAQVTNVAAAPGRWAAIAEGNGPQAWWSTDGRHWTQSTIAGRLAAFERALVAVRDGFLAAGPDAAPLWASSDGRSWAPVLGMPIENGDRPGGAAETADVTLVVGYHRDPPQDDNPPPDVAVVWLGTAATAGQPRPTYGLRIPELVVIRLP